MSRSGWLAVVGLCVLGAAAFGLWRARTRHGGLDCAPSEIGWVRENGTLVARCGVRSEALPPVAQRLAVGQKIDLNAATEAELAQLPGVGAGLARALAAARTKAPFRTWDDVDQVAGVGPAKLAQLQAVATIGAAR